MSWSCFVRPNKTITVWQLAYYYFQSMHLIMLCVYNILYAGIYTVSIDVVNALTALFKLK